jgi:hypothetical protein
MQHLQKAGGEKSVFGEFGGKNPVSESLLTRELFRPKLICAMESAAEENRAVALLAARSLRINCCRNLGLA